MSVQAEFLKNVRESVTSAQAKAAARLGTLEDDARKALQDLVEKSKGSQKDLTALLEQKVVPAAEEALRRVAGTTYKAKVEEFSRLVLAAPVKARGYVDTASREQAALLAAELRRLADRLERATMKADGETTAEEPSTATPVETAPASGEVH